MQFSIVDYSMEQIEKTKSTLNQRHCLFSTELVYFIGATARSNFKMCVSVEEQKNNYQNV